MNVTMTVICENGCNYAVFKDDELGEFYDIWLDNIRSRSDLVRQVEHMSLKNWFSCELRNQLIDLLERRLNQL